MSELCHVCCFLITNVTKWTIETPTRDIVPFALCSIPFTGLFYERSQCRKNVFQYHTKLQTITVLAGTPRQPSFSVILSLFISLCIYVCFNANFRCCKRLQRTSNMRRTGFLAAAPLPAAVRRSVSTDSVRPVRGCT